MNQTDRLERDLSAWFVETATPRTPDFLDDILAQTADANQRAAWTFPERWIPMSVITLGRRSLAPVPWRTVGLLAVLALLVLAAVAVIVGSQPRVPAPFGPAANGLVAYSKDGDIYTVDPATNTRRPIVTGRTDDHDPTWSLTGTRMAFLRATTGGDLLVTADADGTHQVVATTAPLVDVNAVAWSPDGTSIALASSVEGVRGIYIVDTANGDARRLDLGMPADEPSWRPGNAGELVVYGTNVLGVGLFLVRPDDPRPTEIVHAPPDTAILPNGWSPDGRRLAYHLVEQILPGVSVYRIHVRDLASKAEVVLASSAGDRNSGGFGKWSPSGDDIVFLDGGDDCDCNWLSVAPSTGGPAIRLTSDHQAPYGINYAWSPDGTVIYTEAASGGGVSLLDPTSGPLTQQPAWLTDGVSSWQRVAR